MQCGSLTKDSHFKSGKGNCATACYRALLPEGVKSDKLHDFILIQPNTGLEHIAACVALAVYEQTGQYYGYIEIDEDKKPSEFLRDSLIQNNTQGVPDVGCFCGALIRRCFEVDGRLYGHAAAVTEVVDGSRMNVVDRTPVELPGVYSSGVPIEMLDELVTNNFSGELARFMLLVWCDTGKLSEEMIESIEEIQEWERSFADVFTNGS